MPLTRRTAVLAAITLPPARALAQPATPPVDLESALDAHVAWVLSLFDGGAADLTPAEVEVRFDANFRSLVPPDELIATIRQVASETGPLELVEARTTAPGEYVGLFRAESGAGVMISIAVDPATGLIAGFFITPAALPDASPIAPASPAASPVAAGPVVDDPEAQIARYADTLAAIRAVAEPAMAAVLAGDDAALAPLLSSRVADALGERSVADVIDAYTARQVTMTFTEIGASFFGQWNGDTMRGVMVQRGTPFPFEMTATDRQQGALPAGLWSGRFPSLDLELRVTFGADAAGNLTATLDIPRQDIAGAELVDVAYREDQPIGERTGERVFGPGGGNDSATVDFAWGDALLRLTVGVDIDAGEVTALTVLPAVPLPPAPETREPLGTYRLPFDGTWWVFWGGETELQNYHAASSSQRHAYDLVIWQDGATFRGDGARNEDFRAWSQPVLAPAAGMVVEAVDGRDDLAPDTNLTDPDVAAAPFGNHVVIRVAAREHAVIAHLRRGSVRVQPGDRVEAGDPLGLAGSSGNSSEPHVHLHVQTAPDVLDPNAVGLPLRFANMLVDGEPAADALPTQGHFVANP